MSTKHQQQGNEFEELYLKERKKSSILLVAAIVLAISTTGSLIWGVSNLSSTPQLPSGANGQDFGSGGQFGGGPGMGMDIKSFFKEDGSVDTDRIDEITSRLPSGIGSGFTDRIKEQADQAVEDGDITQDQADALKEAIDKATESSNAS